MGLWDDLTGKTAANAAKAAAADQYSKQQTAIGKLLGYGDEYKGSMDTLSHAYDPYAETGRVANDQYQHLLEDPTAVRSLPGYAFDQEEGQRAIDHSSAARGINASGRTLKDLLRFGTGLADKTYGDQLSRLMAGTSLGMQATGAQVGTQSQGLQGQLGARTSAYNGDMTAAGTIGQGDVAAANARAAGSQNIFNTGAKLVGSGIAAATGGMGGGMSSLMSAFGGGGNGTLTGGDAAMNKLMFPGYRA